MIADEKKYVVYKHTNKINGKVYIGITSDKPEDRWRNGNGYKHNMYFSAAINKYMWGNFIHEVLFSNLNKEEACAKEVELIAFYDSTNREKGYNIWKGGEIPTPKKGSESPNNIPIFQYSLDGKFINRYENERLASISVFGDDYHCASIGNARRANRVNKNHIFDGYIWLSEYLGDQIQPFKVTGLKRVGQYTKDGKLIKEWYSSLEAKKEFNDKGAHIQDVCKGKRKTAYGYIWKYLDREEEDN